MKKSFVSCGLMAGWLLAVSAPAAQFKIGNQTFTVPDGFEVERVAASPLVDRPIYGSFDEHGRLYVVDSSGSNDKPDQQLKDKPHRVVRLEASKGDGHFDKTVVFADKMMFPEGCLYYDGSVYVAAPPSIWKLTDTNNDGVADIREEWHQGKTLTGCANDLHGPFLGPDGWIYWCKGAFATQTYERPGQKPFVSRAAHIFRARPDHSGLEPVLTGGMDNPVSVAFTAGGERILCGTFFMTHEPGKRDGLIHAIYGGVYGKINDVTDEHKKTGDLMPIMTHMGPAAPCSIIRYESRVFGEEYQDNLLVCYFNLRKVSRHVLEPDGATFKTKDSDFLTSDNPDFHPTDVIEDADGSLLVIDTGGWYKLCCPTSQLPKPDVLGAVYRIRRQGAPKVKDPRGLTLAWKVKPEELARRLGDERPAIRQRALLELSKLGKSSVAPIAAVLQASDSAETRRWAVWALTRVDAPEARAAVRLALQDTDENVRQVAMHSASLWRDTEAAQELLNTLQIPEPQLQRVAAEALGRIGGQLRSGRLIGKVSEENSFNWIVPGLLTASAEEHDRVLEHSLIYALIETDIPKGTAEGLDSLSPFETRAALVALDQMDQGGLKPEDVTGLLSSADAVLRTTALWVAKHHTEWGDALAGFYRERLAAKTVSDGEAAELQQQLAQFARASEIQNLIATSLQTPGTPAPTRELLLRAMANAGLKQSPVKWTDSIRSCLSGKEGSVLSAAVAAARVLSQVKIDPPDFSESLLAIAKNEENPAALRLEAMAALPKGLSAVEPSLLSFLCANLDSSKPVPVRSAASSVLAKAQLKDEQLLTLASVAAKAGPLELTKLMGAFEQSTNEAVGLKLVESLKQSKSLASVRPDLLKTTTAKYPASVQQKTGELLSVLNVDVAKQSTHLNELLGSLKDGDIRRGQAIFNSPKAACFSCHKLGYMGGEVGPDLTSIGQARTERDLLESIVYPSASFVRSYEPILVRTKTDEQINGLIRKDSADELVLATGPNAEVRIARADITEMRPGTVSVMPAGLDEQLNRQELADLLAFLKATKWGPR
jgi:putative membrane-bound dehydrogenase-like protein